KNLFVITQNVDDLLERAGCKDVVHLHGFLPELRCLKCEGIFNELNEKIQILNKIYSEEILKNKQIFINTKLFFSVNDEFSTYI
ncbi:Sir2 family NAD-dependent protein deacetylase, partial [Campylobacter coli]